MYDVADALSVSGPGLYVLNIVGLRALLFLVTYVLSSECMASQTWRLQLESRNQL